MARICVTGASGKAGRAVVADLLEHDHWVVATDLTSRLGAGAPQSDGGIRPEPMIDAGLVADAVVRMASLPLEANIQFMTLMATKMPFIGRG